MRREYKQLRVEEGRLLHSICERAREGNHLPQASSSHCLFYLLLVACFIGPCDPQNPTLGLCTCPSLKQHRQALDRVDSTQKKRYSWPTLNRSFNCRTHTPWSFLRHINTVRNGRDGHSEFEMF